VTHFGVGGDAGRHSCVSLARLVLPRLAHRLHYPESMEPTSGDVRIRHARKPWSCVARLRDAEGRCRRDPPPAGPYVRCRAEIPVGAVYVEYLGESAPYESGARYCVACAKAEGLIKESAQVSPGVADR